MTLRNLILLVLCGVLAPVYAGDRMDEPYGSRYLNFVVNKVWSSHYGAYSDLGWPTDLYPKFIEDVNGDGMADAVAFGKPGTYVSLSNGTSFVGQTLAIANFGTDQAWSVADDPRFVADINNDGKKDLIGYGMQGVYAATYTGTATTPAFGGFALWSSSFGSQDDNGFYLNAAFIRTMADMNKDGKSDLVVFAASGVYVALSNGTSFDAPIEWIADFGTNSGWNNTDYVREITDVNGDGYPDILGYGDQSVYVATNTQGTGLGGFSAWTTQYSNQDRSGFYTNSNFIRTSGDANGDGMTDLIVFADDGVYVALSTGNGFATGSKWVAQFGTASGGWNNTEYLRLVADLNGDSMADIVGFGSAGTYFSMSQGTGFAMPQMWVSDFGYNQAWRLGTYPRYLRDVNGDGVLDLTGYGYYGVYVSASAPLYCCDRTFFPDSASGQDVIDGYMARVYVPAAYPLLVMPQRDTSICPSSPYLDQYQAVGPNTNASQPWLNKSWRTTLGARFALNANFFDIGHGPTQYQCTFGIGMSISNGTLLSPYTQFNGHDTSTLVIYNPPAAASKGVYAEILPGTQVSSNWQGKVQFAFSGMSLIADGQPVASQPDPGSPRARTSVGITADGKTLLFVIQNNGHDGGPPTNQSASLPGMATALLRMGAHNAINLDGSGSAQFWFKNNAAEFMSQPSDGSGKYRGVPVAFGVK